MITDVVRLVADWLADPVDGVAALLASVPRDVGDPLPASPEIQDETRDNRPGRGRMPERETALVVTSRDASILGQNVVTDDGFARAELMIHISTSNGLPREAKRDAGYYLRAAAWSLRKLHRAPVDDPRRARNQIVLLEIGPVTVLSWEESVQDTTITGALTCTVQARDYYDL